MIACPENPMRSTKKILELISEFSKINIQNPIIFLYISHNLELKFLKMSVALKYEIFRDKSDYILVNIRSIH